MNKTILTTAIFIVTIGSAIAQDYHGGLGNIFCGPVYNISSLLEKELSADALLGSNLKLNTTTFSYGGAGYSIRPKGMVIGGSGYFYNVSATAYNGKAELNLSQGFFNIGYRVLNNKNAIGFPYFGMGAFGSSFKVTNTTSDKLLSIGSDTVAPQKMTKYSTGGLAFEAGFALKYFVLTTPLKSPDKKMKTAVGIDVGASFFPAFEKWQHVVTGDKIASMPVPFTMAMYARVSLGLGVFNYKKI